jgi:Holliday junction DNA helicase RuvA
MRDRLGSLPGGAQPGARLDGPGDGATDASAEAVSALIALGLKPAEATRRVAATAAPELASEEIVRLALKAMVK